MGILNRDEIERRLVKGELLLKARKKDDGRFDIQPDSYDLTVGTAVWKSINEKGEPKVETISFNSKDSTLQETSVSVQPGQMIFVITQEDINMPNYLSGTVFSRNSIALKGILGLNAGHVDPGYTGPIVIRLINLNSIPWTLTLGEPIFTIVFQTLDYKDGDLLVARPSISDEEMLLKVRETADKALSNALFDLYANKIDLLLKDHYTTVQQNLREDLTKTFLPRTDIMSCLFKHAWAWIITGVVVASTVFAALFAILQYYK